MYYSGRKKEVGVDEMTVIQLTITFKRVIKKRSGYERNIIQS